MGKPIKPSKNLVYCYACKRRKMLFEEKSEADNFIKYNHGGILEENGKAPVRSYYCELCCGYHVTSNPSVIDGERQDRQDSQLLGERFSDLKVQSVAMQSCFINNRECRSLAREYGMAFGHVGFKIV